MALRQCHARDGSIVGRSSGRAGGLSRTRRTRPLAARPSGGTRHRYGPERVLLVEICSSLSEESAELVARYNPAGSRYFPAGKVIRPGTVVQLPGLAMALEAFVSQRENFLAGDVGAAIVACVQGHGGALTGEDLLSSARAEWVATARGKLGTLPLFVTPAPTHGPALLRAVANMNENTMRPAVAVYSEIIDALQWQRTELADPNGTSMVSAVDDAGTMVTIVHSNSYPRFGSGLIVDRYDLILANRAGRGFSMQPGHPNFPAAGRRPATTLHAWAVAGPDGARLQGATPGGANQMPWNAQTLARMIAGELDIGRLVVAPRWEWVPADDSVTVESGFEAAEVERLRSTANSVTQVERWALHSAMQIVAVDADDAVVRAAADPRTVGAALAF